MDRSPRRLHACWRGTAAHADFGEHARALLAPREREGYLDHVAAQEAQGTAPPAPPARGKGRARAHVRERPAPMPSRWPISGARSRGLERPRRQRGRAACARCSTFMQGAVDGARRQGRRAHRPADHNGASARGHDHAAQRQRAWFWKIAYDEAFARVFARRAAHARSDAAICWPTKALRGSILRHRRSPDDRSSVARAARARRSADRAERAALAQFRIARHLETLRRASDRGARKRVRDRAEGAKPDRAAAGG